MLGSPYFLPYCLFITFVMFATTYVDVPLVKAQTGSTAVSDNCRPGLHHVFLVMRLGVAAFFLSVAIYGKCHSDARTQDQPPACAGSGGDRHPHNSPARRNSRHFGIASLYVFCDFQYGWFHLLDYPIFLGVAYYLGHVRRAATSSVCRR